MLARLKPNNFQLIEVYQFKPSFIQTIIALCLSAFDTPQVRMLCMSNVIAHAMGKLLK